MIQWNKYLLKELGPHVQGAVAARVRREERSYFMFKVRKGGSEEIPHIQGKKSPSNMVSVARGHQRADTLKPYSEN